MKYFKIKFLMPVIMMASLCLALVNCSGESDNSDNEYVFNEERQEMTAQLEELRDEMDEQLSELQTRMERAGDEAGRENFEEAYEELTGQRNAIDRALADVRNAGSDTWDSVSSSASNTYEDVSTQFGEWQEETQEWIRDLTD